MDGLVEGFAEEEREKGWGEDVNRMVVLISECKGEKGRREMVDRLIESGVVGEEDTFERLRETIERDVETCKVTENKILQRRGEVVQGMIKTRELSKR